jgi:hypothetical protein
MTADGGSRPLAAFLCTITPWREAVRDIGIDEWGVQ